MTVSEFINQVGFRVNQGDINNVNSSINGIKNTAKKALGALGIGLSIHGITQAIKECVALASEAEEMENKFNTVFTGMTDTVNEWAKNYADTIGRNTNDIKTYLADAQNLMVGFMGTDRREDAAEMSKAMTTLAMDLASFSNIDETAAVNYMTKAVMGETESAKMLGAVLNDVTREQAMHTLGLEGTYEALDQVQKMQVNYQAILSQSPDAIGDCERSVNSYRSTLLNFQAKLKEIKTIVGQFFMPTAQKMLKLGANGLAVVRDFVQGINDFADSVGGSTKIIAVFGATIAATMVAMNVSKISTAATEVMRLARSFGAATLSVMKFAVPFLVAFLLIEDFIAFVQGNNSIIGSLFQSLGLDADKARESIVHAWTNAKETLLEVWTAISTSGKDIWNSLKDFWAQWGPTIVAIFGSVMTTMVSLVGPLLTILAELISFVTNVFTGNWAGAWQAVQNIAAAVWAAIQAIFAGAWGVITAMWSGIVSFFAGVFANVQAAIAARISAIQSVIVAGFNAAVSFITGLASQAFSWGADIINNIVSGIRSGIGNIISAASDIASTIRSYLHFTVPDTGPLADFDTYMPDMINLMTAGMNAGRRQVGRAAADLAGSMNSGLSSASKFMASGTVSPATMATARSNSINKSVVQNVEINNQFNGEKAIQQKAAKTMNKSADDVTALLARGLAYAR